jgi:hypothetical protein
VIEKYQFGRFCFDGTEYTKDAIILGGRVHQWRREKGHAVACSDIEAVVAARPEVVVFGTGAFGMMHVSKAAFQLLSDTGIEVIVRKTGKAIEEYNRLSEEGKNAAIAMHLTC